MKKDNPKVELLFKNLPFLLKDMEVKDWIIDSFPFRYKGYSYFVILTRYRDNERKPSTYAKAKVEFVPSNNTNNNSLFGYVDFFNVHFYSVAEFCAFFGIERGNANRDLFKDFSEVFSNFIPKEKIVNKGDRQRILIGSRVEGNNPNAIYCYDVRRNGTRKGGKPNKRSIENSNKAESLRKELYETFCRDKNLSFFFTDKQEGGKSDPEIKKLFGSRK
ncbi:MULTISPECIES: DUF6037 family protein [Oceanobacillus]|uniref:DUF6037 family protein n=2 Tax=Oceanobacillus TaxID=182709 RepID=A0ABW5Q0M0_9BACI|nr:DUF6037 family protein [Oceanobacillus jordanicus]MCG3419706.1 DUF6037 family protein [Oceanobacillus jordanicus]